MRKLFGLVLIVVGLIVAVNSFSGNLFSSKSVGSNANIEKLDFRKYEEIILTSQVCDIEVSATDNAYLELLVDKSDRNFEIITTEKGKTLLIDIKSRKKFNLFNFTGKEVTFLLPKEYDQSLAITQKAGNVIFKDPLKFRKLSVSTKAGNIKNLSGDIDYLTIESSAGNVNGYELKTKEAKIKGKAGDITLEKFSGALFGSTSAGNLKVEYQNENGEVDWKSHAGDILLTIPKPNFELETSAKLGDVNVDFPITTTNGNSIVGNGDKKIRLSVSAGDIEIRK